MNVSADVFFWQAQNANKLDRDLRELLVIASSAITRYGVLPFVNESKLRIKGGSTS